MNQQVENILDELLAYRDLEKYQSEAARQKAREELIPHLEKVERLIRALDHAEGLPTGVHERTVRQYLNSLKNRMQNLAEKPDNEHFYQAWSEEQNNIETALTRLVEELKSGLPIAVALGAPLGFEDLQARVEGLEGELTVQEQTLEEKAAGILDDVQSEADAILEQAREAAGEVALSGAQNEFQALRNGYKRKAIVWGLTALVGVGLYALLIYHFISYEPAEVAGFQDSIYPTTIRIFALGAGAAILALLVRLFRSNLFLFEYSNHRISLTNSLKVFYDAVGEEDRPRVLGQLLGRIAEFGEPGLSGGRRDTPDREKAGTLSNLLRLRE